jgi:hypothetical protein
MGNYNMTKEELYKKMNIAQDDIQKGESQFEAFSPELRKKFLSDIYAEYQGEFFKSLDYIYGEYPNFRKVILVLFAINGDEEEKQRLAHGLSNPYDNKKIEDLFHLTFDWINETNNPKIFESLSRGLMFYIDKIEVQEFLKEHLDSNIEFAKGVFSWLYIQPNWFRDKHKNLEIEIWSKLQSEWSAELTDEFKIREINKSLGLDIDKNEIWLHEIQNPWNFSDSVIKQLSDSGVDIKIDGYIGEFAMGSPLITSLILNGKKIDKAVGGPLIASNDNTYLCCTTFSREDGFQLVLIDLKANEIIDLNRKGICTPYKFENGEFKIIIGDGKIDLGKNIVSYKLNELKLPTTMHKSNGEESTNKKDRNNINQQSWWKRLWS